VADIGDTNYEYDGGQDRGNHDAPDSPNKLAAGVGNTEESDSDATFDGYGTGCVEKLSDEEKLLPMVNFPTELQIEEGKSTHLGSFHLRACRQDVSKLAGPVKATHNT